MKFQINLIIHKIFGVFTIFNIYKVNLLVYFHLNILNNEVQFFL